MKINHIFQSNIVTKNQHTDYLVGVDLLANLHRIQEIRGKNYSSFLLLTDTKIDKLFGNKVKNSLKKLDKRVINSVIPPGEKLKDIRHLPGIVRPFFKSGFDRKACLMALGGGVISDIAGLVSALLLRGIDLIILPTTLLAQIDASIGGKNGVNLEIDKKYILKNMLGTFNLPSAVITDTEILDSLPRTEILNGLGEMSKYWTGWAIPTDADLISVSQGNAGGNLTGIIKACQQIKIDIISRDPFEKKGIRQKLNLGHTIGHAIESASNGSLPHGFCVAIGLIACARISVVKGFLDMKEYLKITNLLKSVGLPQTAGNIDPEKVKSALKMDKKGNNFVLLKSIGRIVTGIPVENKIIDSVIKEIIL